MAYALLAGMPPQAGLYASTIPIALYAFFGTSRQLAVGPVAIVSLLTASALTPLADQGTADYLALAAVLALMVAVVHIVLGVTRMGWVVNLLSHPVLVGFTAAAALIIATSQVKHLLGVKIPKTDGFIETVTELGKAIGDVNWTTVALATGTIVVLIALKTWKKTFPAALVAVVATTIVSQVFDLADRGVSTIGEIPSDLPAFSIPSIDGGTLGSLVPAALVITLAGFMESIAIAKVFARKNRYEVDANQELIGLGAANVGAGLFGGFPVTGGFSRTAVNADAGARTPLASLISVGIILVSLVAITPFLTALPNATLGAIVVVAVYGLIDVAEARHIAKVKPGDLFPMGVAFAATLVLGIEAGIAIAIGASLVLIFMRLMRPHTAELGRIPGTDVYRNTGRFPDAETQPGVAALRLDTSLNFANVAFVKRRLAQLTETRPDATAIVIDFSGVNDLDASGEQALHEILEDFADRGIDIHLATVKGPVRDVLVRSGLWTALGPRVHLDVDHAVRSIEQEVPRLEAAELADELAGDRPTDSVGQAFGAVSR
jgi:SulP family sulfate permease